MTITYTAEVATCKNFGCFLKLLFRWRGSIYKLVWQDLLLFLGTYYFLNFLYRHALDPKSKVVFESFVYYCNSYVNLIPLSFVLGFYVSVVMTRWWDQYITIPWPDSIAIFVSAHIYGQDERGRVMRRTIMRYVCLCSTLMLRLIAPRVKKRFPTLDHLTEAGLLVESEKDVIEVFEKSFSKHPKHWMPIVWAASIVTRARKEGRIRDDLAVKTIIDELNKFRGNCGTLLYYDWISIPLVYTQVVTLAVYSYFLCSVIGRQWTDQKTENDYPNFIDLYFPIFATLQFFFYMGWLKVAESLINPFGEDDDDFEVNWMIDRNLQVSYLIVDEMHHEHPELVRDQYWDEIFPNELPYANESEVKRAEPPESSTAYIDSDYTKKVTANLSNITISGATSSIQANANGKMHAIDSRNTSIYSLRNFKKRDEKHVSGSRLLTPIVSISSQDLDKKGASDVIRNPQTSNHVVTKSSTKPSIKPSITSLRDGSLRSLNINDYDSDDFERLKIEREKERMERQRIKFARNLGHAANLNTDADPVSTSTPKNQISTKTSREIMHQTVPEAISLEAPMVPEEQWSAAAIHAERLPVPEEPSSTAPIHEEPSRTVEDPSYTGTSTMITPEDPTHAGTVSTREDPSYTGLITQKKKEKPDGKDKD